jgi:hypothetical protein
MRQYANGIKMNAGNITLRFINGITEYKLYGYTYRYTNEEGTEFLVLQPADQRKAPALTTPVDEVMYCRIQF